MTTTLTLLRLPAEIRNTIYSFALTPDVYFVVRPMSDMPTIELALKEPTPGSIERPSKQSGLKLFRLTSSNATIGGIALLRVNKQVHGEAAKILYTRNRFSMGSFDDLDLIVASIGLSNASMIHHLEMHVPFMRGAPNALRECSALRTLRVKAFYPEWARSLPRLTGRLITDIDTIGHLIPPSSEHVTLVAAVTREVARKQGFLPVVRRAIGHGWSVRRELLVDVDDDFLEPRVFEIEDNFDPDKKLVDEVED